MNQGEQEKPDAAAPDDSQQQNPDSINETEDHQETKEKQENEKESPDEKQQDSINEEIEQNIATLNRLAVLDLHPSGSGLDTEEDEDGEQTNTKTKPRRANRKMDYALLNTGRQIKKSKELQQKTDPKNTAQLDKYIKKMQDDNKKQQEMTNNLKAKNNKDKETMKKQKELTKQLEKEKKT